MAQSNIKILKTPPQLRGWAREMIYKAKQAASSMREVETVFSSYGVTLRGTGIEVHGVSIPAEEVAEVWLEIGDLVFVDKIKNLYEIIDLICVEKHNPRSYELFQYTMNFSIIQEELEKARLDRNIEEEGGLQNE